MIVKGQLNKRNQCYCQGIGHVSHKLCSVDIHLMLLTKSNEIRSLRILVFSHLSNSVSWKTSPRDSSWILHLMTAWIVTANELPRVLDASGDKWRRKTETHSWLSKEERNYTKLIRDTQKLQETNCSPRMIYLLMWQKIQFIL